MTGAMVLWWVLTIPSLLFVTIDIWRNTPEDKVLRWAFMILTAFLGPIAAFFYVLGCREPLRGTHEAYVATRWRQVLGSTMHCAAGDGIGIVVGAAIGAGLTLAFWPGFLLEYLLGFGFGWTFFQAFAMRKMAGGSYRASLTMTFLPELLSMNMLMAGMQLVDRFWMPRVAGAHDPTGPEFWFIMSMALLAGFLVAYPMNWWLVANHMKHGMLTVRDEPPPAMVMADAEVMDPHAGGEHQQHEAMPAQPSARVKLAMTALSFGVLSGALVIVTQFAPSM